MSELSDAFGKAPAHQPPLKQKHKASQLVSSGLESSLQETTAVLLEMIQAAGAIPAGKMCGCDRCSACTIRISSLVDRWLEKTPCTNPDAALALIKYFVGFPRALVRMISASVKAIEAGRHQGGKSAEGVLPAQLEGLADMADACFVDKQDSFLPFARITRVLRVLLPNLRETSLGESTQWPQLQKRIEALEEKGRSVRAFLDSSLLLEERWLNDLRQQRHTGKKRIEGGGYMQIRGPEAEPAPDPLYVVDFSRAHILVVGKDSISGVQKSWEFYATQRELPFSVDFRPAKQNRGLVRANTRLRSDCGEHYQLLEIVEIDPEYYYLALCAQSLSKHADNAGDRMVVAHDWPRPHAFREPC